VVGKPRAPLALHGREISRVAGAFIRPGDPPPPSSHRKFISTAAARAQSSPLRRRLLRGRRDSFIIQIYGRTRADSHRIGRSASCVSLAAWVGGVGGEAGGGDIGNSTFCIRHDLGPI
jgi:hypothetical protein